MINMSAMTSEEFDSLHSTAPINPRVNNGKIYNSKNARSQYKPSMKKTVVLSLLLAVGGITCCIIGVVFFKKARLLSLRKTGGNDGEDPNTCGKSNNHCRLSDEVKNSGNYLNIFYRTIVNELNRVYSLTVVNSILNELDALCEFGQYYEVNNS